MYYYYDVAEAKRKWGGKKIKSRVGWEGSRSFPGPLPGPLRSVKSRSNRRTKQQQKGKEKAEAVVTKHTAVRSHHHLIYIYIYIIKKVCMPRRRSHAKSVGVVSSSSSLPSRRERGITSPTPQRADGRPSPAIRVAALPDPGDLHRRSAMRLGLVRYQLLAGSYMAQWGYHVWLAVVLGFDLATKVVVDLLLGYPTYTAIHDAMEFNASEYLQWTVVVSGLGWSLAPGVRRLALASDDGRRRTTVLGQDKYFALSLAAVVGAGAAAGTVLLPAAIVAALGTVALAVFLVGAASTAAASSSSSSVPRAHSLPLWKSVFTVLLSMTVLTGIVVGHIATQPAVMDFFARLLGPLCAAASAPCPSLWEKSVVTLTNVDRRAKVTKAISAVAAALVGVPVAAQHWLAAEVTIGGRPPPTTRDVKGTLAWGCAAISWQPSHAGVSRAAVRRRGVCAAVATVVTILSLYTNAFCPTGSPVSLAVAVLGGAVFTALQFWALPTPVAKYVLLLFVFMMTGAFGGGVVSPRWYFTGPHALPKVWLVLVTSLVANLSNMAGLALFPRLFAPGASTYRTALLVTVCLTMASNVFDLAAVRGGVGSSAWPFPRTHTSHRLLCYVLGEGIVMEVMWTVGWMPITLLADSVLGRGSDPFLGGLVKINGMLGPSLARHLTAALIQRGPAWLTLHRGDTAPHEEVSITLSYWILLYGLVLPCVALLPLVLWVVPPRLRIGEGWSYKGKLCSPAEAEEPQGGEAHETKGTALQIKKQQAELLYVYRTSERAYLLFFFCCC
eukprot:gene10939-7594_t